MTKKTDLTLLILNYNSQFWLKKTLETLKKYYLDHTSYSVEVVVVDNNSSDDSLQMLKSSFRWVTIEALDENVGFAAGNNVWLKKATSTYTMLLNSDLEFTPDSNLDVLIAYMDAHPHVGVISPRLELPDGQVDPACHRGEPTLWASFTYFAKLEAIFPQSKKFGQYHQLFKDLLSIHEIDAVSGAAMLVRQSALKKVGYLDEQFFMYAEDIDWCRRFREQGHKIIYNPEVRIIHHKYKSGIKSSSKQIASQTNRHFYDTMLQYYDKYYRDQNPRWLRSFIKYILAIKKEG